MDEVVDAERVKAGPLLLEARGLTKTFGTLTACDSIDLSVAAGEIHALLGENGAGKSTLVKMLFGALEPNAGVIRWKGEPVRISSPAEARRLGIGMVFQHFSLFEALTAAENILLSLERNAPMATIAARARELADTYGLPFDPNAHVGDLSVGERQRIEIIRCLMQQPDLIVLDEPTSVLTPQEADRLFSTLERLRGEGKAIVYISHRLDEVKRLCERATVLRHGKVMGQCDPRTQTAASLARMMVGSNVPTVVRAPMASDIASRPLLEVKALERRPATPFSVPLRGIDLVVPAGQVMGIAGVAGNGQSELFEAISGEVLQQGPQVVRIGQMNAGQLPISGRRLLGAAFIPEERLGHSAVPRLALKYNLLLSRHDTDRDRFIGAFGWLREKALGSATARVVQAMDVRVSGVDTEAAALSGGNLQKFILGRELDRQPPVLVVNQPTWGVDAGAAARIRQALIGLARDGSAVVVISQDLDELFEISDAIAVMHDGRLSSPIPIDQASYEQVGLLMGGAEPGHAASEGAA